MDLKSKENQNKFINDNFENLLQNINDTYGPVLVEELKNRISHTIEEFNDEMTIAFDQLKDSIIFMYKNSDQNNEYRLRLTSMDISETSTRDTLFTLSNLDSTSQGVYSIAYGDSNLYLLTANQNNHTLLTLDYYTLAVKTIEIIEDSTLAGIEIVSDSIYFSYKDKKIEPY